MEPTKRELLVEETHYKEVELQPLNSEKIDFPKSKKNPLAALYYNVDTMKQAKRRLEEEGYHVLGCFISPCSTAYARRKLGAGRVDTTTRVALIKAIIAQEDFITISLTECLHRTLHCKPALMYSLLKQQLQELLYERNTLESVEVFWLKGIDGYFPFCDADEMIVINRNGYEGQSNMLKRSLESKDRERKIFMVEAENLQLSSTAIRAGEETAIDQAYEGFPDARALFYAPLWGESSEVFPTTEVALDESDFNNWIIQNIATVMNHLRLKGKLVLELLDAEYLLNFPTPSKMDASELEKSEEKSDNEGGSCIKIDAEPRREIRCIPHFGRGKGLRSNIIKVEIVYDEPFKSQIIPEGVLLKISLCFRDFEETFYAVEENFYQKVGWKIECVRIPRCVGRIDFISEKAKPLHCLAIECISSLRMYEFPSGAPPFSAVQNAVYDLARFHAHFWGDRNLLQMGFNSFDAPETVTNMQYMWKLRFTGWKKELIKKCSPSLFDFLTEAATDLSLFFENLKKCGGMSLIHRDLWINNFGWAPNQNDPISPYPEKLCIFDWETCAYGPAVIDLASLLDTTQATQNEVGLLSLYYDTLLRFGVESLYSWEAFIEDFKLGKRFSLLYHHHILLWEALFSEKIEPDLAYDLLNR